ncbi:MAG: TVP38/TMEM64 family protein, partial [Planctomycetota bacterium]
AGILVATRLLPLGDLVRELLASVEQLGPWGPVIVGLVYVPAAVLMVPGSILTLGAGFLFELHWAVLSVILGATAGSCAAFLVGRTVARAWVASRVAGNPTLAAVDEAVAREGFKIVLLTRLSAALPYNLLNYFYGITRVGFWRYALGTLLGMLPGTVMYVYLGSGARSLAQVGAGDTRGSTVRLVTYLAGLVVAVAVALYVARVARKVLHERLPSGPAGEDASQAEDHPPRAA